MSRRVRVAVVTPALAAVAALVVWGFTGLPDFGNYKGPYGYVLNRVATPERHTTNVVGATTFDYRGIDTLGEEFILFAAVMGVVLLLRGTRERREREAGAVTSEALRLVGLLTIGPALLVGLWIVAFGYVTPGGGFQGGVILGAATLLLFLAGSYGVWHRATSETHVDPVEGTGAGGYVVVGLAALISGAPFLKNLLGPGDVGTLWSGGSIAFLSWSSALEVAAANVLLFREFLEEYVVPLARGAE